MDEYLSIRNLEKTYTDKRGSQYKALNGISLEIRKGEFVTILGPSGCGKTTTLRILAGFIEPSGGEIFFLGKSIDSVPAHQRPMTMVFQNFALFPHLQVHENIAYGLNAKKIPSHVKENEVAFTCLMMNLTGLENRYPNELSGGQQQRVALARAIINKPDIVLFDEPLSNLDLKLRIQTRTEIKRLQQQIGMTVLYVTHDQTEAMSISDSIVIMNRGSIVQKGCPSEIYQEPISPFVADFIGGANFFEATLLVVEKTEYKVLFSGVEIDVPRKPGQKKSVPGDSVLLAIKPENITLHSSRGLLKGVVEICSFQGALIEYRIMYSGGTLTVLQSNIGIRSDIYGRGDDVYMDFAAEHISLFFDTN